MLLAVHCAKYVQPLPQGAPEGAHPLFPSPKGEVISASPFLRAGCHIQGSAGLSSASLPGYLGTVKCCRSPSRLGIFSNHMQREHIVWLPF